MFRNFDGITSMANRVQNNSRLEAVNGS